MPFRQPVKVSGGLREDLDPSELPDDAAAYELNLVHDKSSAKVRAGYEAQTSIPTLLFGPRSIAQYVPPKDTGQYVRLVVACGNQVYATDTKDQKCVPGLTLSTTVKQDNRVRFAQFNRSLVFVDGDGPVKECFNLNMFREVGAEMVYDAANLRTAYTHGITLTASRIFITNVEDTGPAGTPGLLAYVRTTGAFDVAVNPADFDNKPVAVIHRDAFLWVLVWMDAGTAVGIKAIVKCDDTAPYAVVDTLPILYGAAADQVSFPHAFAFWNGRFDSTAASPEDWIFIVQWTAPFIRIWSAAGVHQANWGTAGTTIQTGTMISPSGIAITTSGRVFICDSSRDCVMEFDVNGTFAREFQGTGIATPVGICLSPDETELIVASNRTLYLAHYSLDGVYLGATNRISQASGSVTDETNGLISELVGSTWETFLVERGKDTPQTAHVEKYTRTLGAETDVRVLTDTPVPPLAPTAALTTGVTRNTQDGVWQFASVYARLDGYFGRYSDLSPVLDYTVGPTVAPNLADYISVTVTISSSAVAPSIAANDFVLLYAKDPTSTEWILVGSYPWDGSATTHVFTVSDSTLAAGTVRDKFSACPPIGATICYEHQNRVFVAAPWPGGSGYADTLYASDFGNVHHFYQGVTTTPADTDGFYVRIGQDGLPITGLHKYGSSLAVFKERGLWLLDGISPSDVHLFQVSEYGCCSNETICEVDGGALQYLSTDGIRRFDGSSSQLISLPVNDKILAMTAEQRGAAFAVYDQDTKEYRLDWPE